jgi:hypothetical protein
MRHINLDHVQYLCHRFLQIQTVWGNSYSLKTIRHEIIGLWHSDVIWFKGIGGLRSWNSWTVQFNAMQFLQGHEVPTSNQFTHGVSRFRQSGIMGFIDTSNTTYLCYVIHLPVQGQVLIHRQSGVMRFLYSSSMRYKVLKTQVFRSGSILFIIVQVLLLVE